MRKLTRTEANFENLLEAAILVEGRCSHAAHGCSCRGCDECEENYTGYSDDEDADRESLHDLMKLSEIPDFDPPAGITVGDYRKTLRRKILSLDKNKGDNPTLAELIDNELGERPNTDIPYDNPDEEQEAFQIGDIGDVIKTAVSLPTEKELKQKKGGFLGIGGDPVVDKVIKIRREVGNKLDAITARLKQGGGVY
jgi:hypothetical protein